MNGKTFIRGLGRRAWHRNSAQRPGLILLVVLGMLALFSLLAVTYVVFSSQSRAASIALARSQIRGKQNRQPLLEEAIMALVRGPTARGPAMNGHSLLEDLYGSSESFNPIQVNVRNRQFSSTGGPDSPMTYNATSGLQRAMVLNGHYLRIPLEPGGMYMTPNLLPIEHDVLNGRVVTFLEGNGPLSGQSFHIVRYIGRVFDTFPGSVNADQEYVFSQSYSILIDLKQADLEVSHSAIDSQTNTPITQSVGQWVAAAPPTTGPWAAGVYACYQEVGVGASAPLLAGGYSLMINAAPLNAHGVGVLDDGSSQFHHLGPGTPTEASLQTPATVASALQPNYEALIQPSPLVGGATGTLTSNLPTSFTPAAPGILGDADEPWDAADFQNMYLSYTESGAATPVQVIPSFHRAALINYLINWKPGGPANWTEAEFLTTLRRIELAMIRPISYNITTPSGAFVKNANFTGSNPGDTLSTTRLEFTVPNWANWGTLGLPQFLAWANSLTLGPWDVDGNGDGLSDSVWVDPGLPLQTTADGKLLKALAAYYVDDLDSKLDVNATSSLAQTNDRALIYGVGNQYAVPINAAYPIVNRTPATPIQYLPQGFGYGPAEISFRHLMSKAPGFAGVDAQELAYRDLIRARYLPNPNSTVTFPGTAIDDPLSLLNPMRERRLVYTHGNLPGLPSSPNGRAMVGIDRLGNPLVSNVDTTINESVNDPYEMRLITPDYQDSPYTISEWERIYRVADSDRSGLPRRLEEAFGENATTIADSTLRREITPLSRYLRVPKVGARGNLPNVAFFQHGGTSGTGAVLASGPSSFFHTINMVLSLKGQTPIPKAAYRALFPLEYHRAQAMNLNRPFGNGIDDDNDGEIDEPGEFSTLSGTVTYTGQRARYADNANVGYELFNALEDYFEIDPATPNAVLPATRLASLGVEPPQFLDYSSVSPIFWGQETRQVYARHLYVLAQLILPRDYSFPSIEKTFWQTLLETEQDTSLPAADRDAASAEITRIRARILAQWAVNVVDFRDADSVMTRFAYDPDPFLNTDPADPNRTTYFPANDPRHYRWDPLDYHPSEPTTPARTPNVVWGMEQPELLLSESFATHDIRVAKDPNATPDRFDQYRKPEGSLWLEFYNPRTTASGANGGVNNQQAQGVSPGLYTTRPDGSVALNLGKLAPAFGSPSYSVGAVPVWRVYISEATDIDTTLNGQPVLNTPNKRLMADPTDASLQKRHDLTYQLPRSNLRYDASGAIVPGSVQRVANSGLRYDYSTDTNELLSDPEPDQARVIVFAGTGASTFTPDETNSPGLEDPESQVFVNRSGAMQLAGGQYLVVGPRPVTYFGSRTTAPTDESGFPGNSPSQHRIELDGGSGANGLDWLRVFKNDGTEITQRATMNDCLTMVAAADAPATEWNSGLAAATIGINVSEPLPRDGITWPTQGSYYPEPSDVLNSDDTTADGLTGAPGFDNLPNDAYFDYRAGGRPGAYTPFDYAKTDTPLEHWDPDQDGNVNFIDLDGDMALGVGDVVEPGTQLDWCNAYLQRLADPNKPFHPTYNPYITVDWIPIDLTVFNGEDGDPQFQPDPAGTDNTNLVFFKTRQKTGQTLSSATLAYDPAGSTGETFMSLMTDIPADITTAEDSQLNAALTTFFKYQLQTDTPGINRVRPTTADGQREASDPETDPSQEAFSTLGFLNSTYKLSGEGGALTYPPAYLGAPAEPLATGATGEWHPDALFWANRSFVNSLELMWVPTSGPCAIMQEFTATQPGSNDSPYAPAFTNDDTGGTPASFMPEDPRTPTAPASPEFDVGTLGPFATNANAQHWPTHPADPTSVAGTPNAGLTVGGTDIEPAAFTPYAYLLNFFQEVPELSTPFNNPATDPANDRHPKNTALTMLLDLVETPAPWSDAYRLEAPRNFAWQNHNAAAANLRPVVASENILFGSMRAPYNGIPEFVEPGRINLNTVSEPNVLHGLGANVMTPTDVDFSPYAPGNAFGGVEDIDHDGDGSLDTGERTTLGNAFTTNIWTLFSNSRRGFDQATGAYQGGYTPDVNRFNPHFPTRFAGVFKPAFSAGMVPVTRNPFYRFPNPRLNPGDGGYATSGHVAHIRSRRLAEKKGVLDLFARQNPAYATLLRGLSNPPLGSAALPYDADNDGSSDTAGVYTPGSTPLFTATGTKRSPLTDFYPMMRLKNMTSCRSNVFAVYVTIGLFEYDELADELSVEYGSERGEQQRYRAFYVIDRSKPVGFQVGVDHNAADTIIARRFLNSEDE